MMEYGKSVGLFMISNELIGNRSTNYQHPIQRLSLFLLHALLKQHLFTLTVLSSYLALKKYSKSKHVIVILLYIASAVNFSRLLHRQLKSININTNKISPTKLLQCLAPIYPTHIQLYMSSAFIVHRDVPYSSSGNMSHKCDVIYCPKVLPTKVTVVVWVHGGGWMFGDKKMQHPMFVKLANEGFIIVTANYRLISGNNSVCIKDQICDTKRCIAWVKSSLLNVLDMNYDDVVVYLGGSSAGSNIALCCALTINESEYQPSSEEYEITDTSIVACIDMFGSKNMTGNAPHYERMYKNDWNTFVSQHIFKKELNQETYELYAKASPLLILDTHPADRYLPLFLGFHGTHDSLVSVIGTKSSVLAVFRCLSRILPSFMTN